MTWALVQTGNSGNAFWNGGDSPAVTGSFPTPVTSGNLVLGHWSNDLTNGPPTSITDDKGNSYTIGTAFNITGDNQAHGWFYLANITNGPQTISVNFSPSNVFCILEFWEVSGLASAPFDVEQGLWQSAPGSGTDAVESDATGIATTANNEVAFGFWCADRSVDPYPIPPGTGWTLQSQVTDSSDQVSGSTILATETQGISTSGTLAKATYTAPNGSGEYSTIVVTFKVGGSIIVQPLEGASFERMTAKGVGAGTAVMGGRASSQVKVGGITPAVALGANSNLGRYSMRATGVGILGIAGTSQSQGKGQAGLGHPIFMSARSFVKMAGQAAGAGAVGIAGRAQSQGTGRAASGGRRGLSGRAASQSKGRAPVTTATALQTSGRAASMSKGSGALSGSTGIGGFTLMAMSGKGEGSGSLLLALFGLSASQGKGRGSLPGTRIALAGWSGSQGKARAVGTGVVGIAGRTLMWMADKAAGAGASALAARATSQSKGNAGLSGRVFVAALAGRTAAMSKGRGAISGKLGIEARSTSQSKGRADALVRLLLSGRTAAQGKGSASPHQLVLMRARSASMSMATAGLSRAALNLGGISLTKMAAKALGVQAAGLSGRSASQGKGEGGIVGTVPMQSVTGRSGSQSKAARAYLQPISPYFPPYYPPISPYVMPYQPFDAIIARYGIALTWERSHQCPCVYGSFGLTGSPDPKCQTCHGLGWYWDQPFGPFQGLITFIRLNPSPDEPGALMSEKWGVEVRQEPTVTIPFSAGLVWEEASVMDRFVEIDAIDRFNTNLIVGGNQTIPYSHNVTVQPTGAVTVYDSINHEVVPVSGYVVTQNPPNESIELLTNPDTLTILNMLGVTSTPGLTVTLPPEYPEGTAYTVEFTAAKTYIAWRNAGAVPHDRPFGQVTEPKRFRFQTLDLWLRTKGG